MLPCCQWQKIWDFDGFWGSKFWDMARCWCHSVGTWCIGSGPKGLQLHCHHSSHQQPWPVLNDLWGIHDTMIYWYTMKILWYSVLVSWVNWLEISRRFKYTWIFCGLRFCWGKFPALLGVATSTLEFWCLPYLQSLSHQCMVYMHIIGYHRS